MPRPVCAKLAEIAALERPAIQGSEHGHAQASGQVFGFRNTAYIRGMEMNAVRLLLGVVCLGALLGACSDDDDGPACPNVSGQWEITQHCQPSAVGSRLVVEQNGCTVSTSGANAQFDGSVAASGEVSVNGSLLGLPIQCSGTATPTHVTLNCAGGCQVTLERP
jgi:hypothetical protein